MRCICCSWALALLYGVRSVRSGGEGWYVAFALPMASQILLVSMRTMDLYVLEKICVTKYADSKDGHTLRSFVRLHSSFAAAALAQHWLPTWLRSSSSGSSLHLKARPSSSLAQHVCSEFLVIIQVHFQGYGKERDLG